MCHISQAVTHRIRHRIQLFHREMRTVDPKSRIPKPLGPCGVPATKRSEKNVLTWESKRLYPQLIGTRIRFVRVHLVRAQGELKQALEAGVLRRGIEHREGHIGQEREPDTRVLQ